MNEQTFVDYFKKLHNCDSEKPNNEFNNTVIKNLNLMKSKINDDTNVFNQSITGIEIIEAIKSLKNGKSSAKDLISNEMVKHGMPILLEPIIKLFNLVFETSSFPAIWNESLISLIHKKGCKQDLSNYRGISVTSNLGKLFNKIIHNRLKKLI